MKFWRRHRSAGITVSGEVHRAIAAGDAARSRHDWISAAAAYRRALAVRSDLAHIHVQLGHALKMAGHWEDAESAYRHALARDGVHRDAGLALAHLLKDRGRRAEAARQYVTLATTSPADREAMREARESLAHVEPDERRHLVRRLLDILPDMVPTAGCAAIEGPDEAVTAPRMFFDVSDLISYFGHSRRPTGIQRVQLEVVLHALDKPSVGIPDIGLCCFLDGPGGWVAVPHVSVLHLAALSLGDASEDEWNDTRDRLQLELLLAEPVRFSHGAALVNLGTSWWLQNYFLHLRAAQQSHGVVYIPMIHDTIPAVVPQFCLDPVVQDFVAWSMGIFAHADRFLCNSESTKRDLVALAPRVGRHVDPDRVGVVPLDGRHRGIGNGTAELPERLRAGRRFVLFVATIEPRKGHLVALAAWRQLLDDPSDEEVPDLVCVGRAGWHNAPVAELLAGDAELAANVIFMSDVSDATLASLYGACLFAIYPSLYEGWGLPVTEALAHGKIVVTTTSSSLPEAGGDFAIYVAPGDAGALAAACAGLIRQDDLRKAAERRIVRDFHPRTWTAIAADIRAQADALRRYEPRIDTAPPAVPDRRFQWLSRPLSLAPHIDDDNGERCRAGTGWFPPDAWGSRVAEDGGEVAFRQVPPTGDGGPCVLTVRLFGSQRARCSYMVRTGSALVEGVLGRMESRSITLPIEATADGLMTFFVAGSTKGQQVEVNGATVPAPIETVGVHGFAIAAAGDTGPGEREDAAISHHRERRG